MAKLRTPPSLETFETSPVRARKPVRGSLIFWLRFFGVIAFLVILLRLPPSQNIQLVRIDLRWLGFCMLLTVCQILVEVLAWQWLLSSLRIRHPFPSTLQAYLASQYLGLVTPGHVGEFLAAGYVSMNTGITFGYALSSVVMKKSLTWIVVMGFGIWGLQLLAHVTFLQGVKWVTLATLGILVILSAGITIWILSLRRLARRWEKLSPWQIDMTEFKSGMKQLLSAKLIFPFGLCVVAFSIVFLQLDFVLRALGISLPITVVAQIVAFSRVVAKVVPISVVGFGSKDAAVIGMLQNEGIKSSVGLTATLLLLLCSYLVTLLLSGLCWWIKPLVIRRMANRRFPR